ncbi:hypothetical protein ABPG75_006975 [Micractinium tetrahymenae]
MGGKAAPQLSLAAALPLPSVGSVAGGPSAAAAPYPAAALQQQIYAHSGAAGSAGGGAPSRQLQQLGQHPPAADPHHLLPAQYYSRAQLQQAYQPGPCQPPAVQRSVHAGAAGLPPRHPHSHWGGAGGAGTAGAAPRQPLAELLAPLQPAPAGLAALLPAAAAQGAPPLHRASTPVAVPGAAQLAPAWSATGPLAPPAPPPSGCSAASSAFASCDSQEEAWETHSFGCSLECSETLDDLEQGFASAGLTSAGPSPFQSAASAGFDPFLAGMPTAAAAGPLHAAPTVAAAAPLYYTPSLDGLDPVAAAALAEAAARAAHEGRPHQGFGAAGYLQVQPSGTLDGYGFSQQTSSMAMGFSADPGHLVAQAAAARAQQQAVWEQERQAAAAAAPSFSPAELREANAAISAIAIPGLRCFVPVHETDRLIPLATQHGIPPISIALGASYFQRLLVHNPVMQEVAKACGFFISTYPTAPAASGQQPSPVVMMRACNAGTPQSDYLLAVYCTCIYLAGAWVDEVSKVADRVKYKQMLSRMLTAVVGQDVAPADAINLESLVLQSLDWRLGPFFDYGSAPGPF